VNLDRFVAERSTDWAELQNLVTRASGQVAKLPPSEVRRLGSLYRSAASDLAVARRSFPDSAGTLSLQALVARANALVYSRAARGDSAGEFMRRTLWQRIWQLRRSIAISAGILFGFVVLGVLWGLLQPAAAVGLLPAGFHATAHNRGGFYGVAIVGRAGLAVSIFVNNILVSVAAMAGGFTFGILTGFSLAYNGALLGVLGALEYRAGGLGSFLSLIVPHGLLELSCITLAGATGFAIAAALVDPGRDTRAGALERLVPSIGAAILGVMVFLVVAGLTEGIITPWDLPTAAALAVGLALAGGFWSMVVLRGRRI
jgi:uncharacterized membrane protein SpoIIM required for sporulation